MSAELIPFGKYKGQPVAQLQNDAEYTKWLMQQPWFVERYSGIRTLIVNNFKEEAESPEHNAFQVQFLDPSFSYSACVYLFGLKKFDDWIVGVFDKASGDLKHWEKFRVEFEVDGWDVVVHCECHLYNKLQAFAWGGHFRFELKPTIGEDFPSVFRQVKSRKANGGVLAKSFTANSVEFQDVRRMFQSSGYHIGLTNEMSIIEAESWMRQEK
jgi:uncharacterized protein (DUF3820 family)